LRGKAAGKALLQLNEIRINPALFLENMDEFLSDVIPHELAHLITYQRFGRVKPHGKEWQWVMSTILGISAKTTHSFDISSVQGEQFTYQCHCTTHQLTIRRHNKVQKQGASYVCKECRSELRYSQL
jgi:SprT protein